MYEMTGQEGPTFDPAAGQLSQLYQLMPAVMTPYQVRLGDGESRAIRSDVLLDTVERCLVLGGWVQLCGARKTREYEV